MNKDSYYFKCIPVTSLIGFIKADVTTVSAKFQEWVDKIFPDIFVSSNVSDTFPHIFNNLSPLTKLEGRKYLFVPTINGWTAVFNNSRFGSIGVTSVISGKLNIDAVLVCYVENTINFKTDEGELGAVQFSVFGDIGSHWDNRKRALSLVNEGNHCARWAWDESGQVQPYEETENYSKKIKKERLTIEMVVRYLNYYGIDILNEHYFIGEKSILFEKITPPYEGETFTEIYLPF